MRFLIAYDIADPRRLRKVARRLERLAVRCQKSVFLFQGDEAALLALLDEAAGLIEVKEDVLQAWKLRADQPSLGVCRGTPTRVYSAAVVLSPGAAVLVPVPQTPRSLEDNRP